MGPRLCALSVDLDEIHHYFAIHGLTSAVGRTAVYDVAMPRLLRFAAAVQVPLTFFAVGDDLERPESAAMLRRAVEEGHSVGNHTQRHRYDLTRLPAEEMHREVEGGARAIERACGRLPEGFRAPGYTITDALFDVLRDQGVRWDSSVFPCPSYMLVKDVAIATYALRGRPSRSIVDSPSVLLSPTVPYRIGRPFHLRGDGMLELPIQVTRGLRLPYIGTSLVLAGADRARVLTRWVIGAPLVNLELHGIDLLDAQDEGLWDLGRAQRDLKVPVTRKEATLGAVVDELRTSGYAFVGMDEAAEVMSQITAS